MAPYCIIPVPDVLDLSEQLGTKEKYWFWMDDTHYLLKLGRAGTGENWAEKAACELCALLGLPHAHYEFGVWKGKMGVISPTVVPPNGRLTLGNEQLEKADLNYPREQKRGVSQHTVRRVAALMQAQKTKALPPLDWRATPQIKTALDVFVGYLMLDAWIGNSDRHHENWGFILTDSNSSHLAPTFDHASSLGCHETDAKRAERLETRDAGFRISSYVTKARSALYLKPQDKKPLTTLDAFRYLAEKRKWAACAWLERLGNVTSKDCEHIFEQIPAGQINDLAKAFALKMLEENKNRLLTLKDQFA